jgi:AAA family ATP:ADP antiporter
LRIDNDGARRRRRPPVDRSPAPTSDAVGWHESCRQSGVIHPSFHGAKRVGRRWRLLDIRPEERRVMVAAFLVLFGWLAAHTILETGRDALFLSRLPASQLPWMYLAMAVLAILFTRTRASSLAGGRALPALLAVCAGGTLLFWAAPLHGPWGLRALYVWTGLAATLISVAFWLLLGEIYTIAQARRLYASIGLGSQLGAMAGAAVARAMSGGLAPHHLLAAAAAVFLLTALGPARLVTAAAQAVHQDAPVRAAPIPLGPLDLRRETYLVRVAGLVLLSTVAFTLGDYVFRSAVAQAIPPARLGRFFASFYLTLGAVSIAAQLLLSGWLIRVLGVSRALAALPLLVIPGAIGVAAGAGLVGALLLKTIDGALRPSLNRVGTELLFVPVPENVRSRAKPTIDVFGARGGQALASLFILGTLASGGSTRVIAGTAALTCLAWAGLTLALQPHYLDVFRAAVRKGTLLDGSVLPTLDLSSLEAVFAALNSRDDGEVLAALELLGSQGRARVMPALLLHHPSKPVVLRTLTLLAATKRVDWLPVAERLMESGDAEIRAAALRARTTANPDESALRAAVRDPSPLVRATALVGLIGSRADTDGAWTGLRTLAASASSATRIAVAEAIEQQPAPVFAGALLRLAESPDARVLTHVARAMAKVKSRAFLPTLIGWLRARAVRDAAREALREHGDEGLRALDDALFDPRTPPRVREHIPRTISLFPPDEAVAVLQRHLLAERDGKVRFKILRGLGRIATDHPNVRFDPAVVREAAARTVDAAIEVLRFRVGLVRGAQKVPARSTPAHRVLVTLLRDKESHRIERFFRVIQLRFRNEDVRAIHWGLRNADRRVRALSRELLEHLLEEPLRGTVMALVDDLPDEERLARLARGPEPDEDYHGLLSAMVEAGSPSLRSLAALHADELGFAVGAVPGPFAAATDRHPSPVEHIDGR